MKKGAQKSPLTKEDILRQQEREKNKKFIKEQFYPAIVAATISVDEASQLLQATSALLMEEALESLRTKRVHEIKDRLIKKLAPNNERLLQIENLIKIFDNETLFNARGQMESMKAVIEQMKMDEFRARKLDSMKPDWDRYLVK